MTAKLKVTNRSTGKTFTATSDEVKILKANTALANVFSYEAEQQKPEEPKINTSK